LKTPLGGGEKNAEEGGARTSFFRGEREAGKLYARERDLFGEGRVKTIIREGRAAGGTTRSSGREFSKTKKGIIRDWGRAEAPKEIMSPSQYRMKAERSRDKKTTTTLRKSKSDVSPAITSSVVHQGKRLSVVKEDTYRGRLISTRVRPSSSEEANKMFSELKTCKRPISRGRNLLSEEGGVQWKKAATKENN